MSNGGMDEEHMCVLTVTKYANDLCLNDVSLRGSMRFWSNEYNTYKGSGGNNNLKGAW